MTLFDFNDAQQAREAIEAGMEYLSFEDGYTAQQLGDYCAEQIRLLHEDEATHDRND